MSAYGGIVALNRALDAEADSAEQPLHLAVHIAGKISLANHKIGHRQVVVPHGIQIALEPLHSVHIPLGAPHEQNLPAAVDLNQVGNHVVHTMVVVGNDVVAVGQVHLLGDNHQGAAVEPPGKGIRIVLVQVEADGAVADDEAVCPADAAIVVNGVELVVINVAAEIPQNALEEGLGMDAQEEEGIQLLFPGLGHHAPDHFPCKIGMHTADHNPNRVAFLIIHDITSCICILAKPRPGRKKAGSGEIKKRRNICVMQVLFSVNITIAHLGKKSQYILALFQKITLCM